MRLNEVKRLEEQLPMIVSTSFLFNSLAVEPKRVEDALYHSKFHGLCLADIVHINSIYKAMGLVATLKDNDINVDFGILFIQLSGYVCTMSSDSIADNVLALIDLSDISNKLNNVSFNKECDVILKECLNVLRPLCIDLDYNVSYITLVYVFVNAVLYLKTQSVLLTDFTDFSGEVSDDECYDFINYTQRWC